MKLSTSIQSHDTTRFCCLLGLGRSPLPKCVQWHPTLISCLLDYTQTTLASGQVRTFSIIESTARAFLSVFEQGSAQNIHSIMNRGVTPTYIHTMVPASVPHVFGLLPDHAFDIATWEQLFAKDIKILKFKSNIMAHPVIDAEASRAAFKSIAEVHHGMGEQFEIEQTWMLCFDRDGGKVERVVEFCDKEWILKMAGIAAYSRVAFDS